MVEIGAKQMIPGFEDEVEGLEGRRSENFFGHFPETL